ncbi:MAG: hypothetical protein OEZ14_14870, partial [Acidimicrobiia bacterium]|nr:hypothetical protein [Acidimicrobiia bacterium]
MSVSPLARGRSMAVAAVLAIVAAACSGGGTTDLTDGAADAGYSLAFDDGSPESLDEALDGDDEGDAESTRVDERSNDHLFRVLESLKAGGSQGPATSTTSTTTPADGSAGG